MSRSLRLRVRSPERDRQSLQGPRPGLLAPAGPRRHPRRGTSPGVGPLGLNRRSAVGALGPWSSGALPGRRRADRRVGGNSQRLHNDPPAPSRHRFQASIGSQTRSAAGGLRGMEDRSEFGDQSIGATAFTGYGRPSRTFASGRVCTEPGCDTKLSIYNDDEYCCLHLSAQYTQAARQEDRLRRRKWAAAPYTGSRDQPRVVGRGPTRRHLGGHARLTVGPPRGRDARRGHHGRSSRPISPRRRRAPKPWSSRPPGSVPPPAPPARWCSTGPAGSGPT